MIRAWSRATSLVFLLFFMSNYLLSISLGIYFIFLESKEANSSKAKVLK